MIGYYGMEVAINGYTYMMICGLMLSHIFKVLVQYPRRTGGAV